MQFLFFTIMAVLVALGVQRMARDSAGSKKAFSRKKAEKPALPAQEMTQCPVCKIYVIKDAAGNCPNCSTSPPSAA